MAKELHGSFGLQPALDRLVGESGDAEGELRLGDAGLDAQRLGDHMPRPTDGFRYVVEPHVAEIVKSPGFHDRLLTQARKFLQRVAVRWNNAFVASRRPRYLADVKVTPRIEAEVVGSVEVAGGTGIRPTAPARKEPAIGIEDADPAPGRLRAGCGGTRPHRRPIAQFCDKDAASGVDDNLARPRDVGPLLQELAVGTEELKAAVLAVGNNDRAIGCDRDPLP
jgi:hypothetical protein